MTVVIGVVALLAACSNGSDSTSTTSSGPPPPAVTTAAPGTTGAVTSGPATPVSTSPAMPSSTAPAKTVVTTTQPTTTARPATVTSYQIAPGLATDGYVGARQDVTDLACTGTGGSWTAGGTVTNTSTAAADYRIYVSFVDSTNHAAGIVQVDVKGVAAAEHRPWTASLPVTGTDLACVLRVERLVATP